MTPSFPTRRSSDLVNIYNAKWRACAVSQLAFLPAVAPTCDSVLDLTSAPVSNVRCVQALRLELLTTQGILWLLRALQCRVCQRYLVSHEPPQLLPAAGASRRRPDSDRKSTRLNSSH